MNKELISIIVPIYKVEKYLEKCLNSIINQTYKNIEIILIDDGSPDNCGKICDEYAKKDSRIKVFHQENKGVSAVRNFGIKKATGKYIMFIDSDDYVDKTMAEHLYDNLKEYNADISVCGFYFVINGQKKRISKKDEIKILSSYNAIKASYNINEIFNILCNKLFKKELFNNIKCPEGRIIEDLFIVYLLLDKSNSIVVSTKPLYYYLKRNSSATGNKNVNLSKDKEKNEKYCKDRLQGYTEKYYFVKNKYPKMEENYKYTIINVLNGIIGTPKSVFKESRKLVLEVLKAKPSIILSLSFSEITRLIIFLISIRFYQFIYYLLKKLSNL